VDTNFPHPLNHSKSQSFMQNSGKLIFVNKERKTAGLCRFKLGIPG
jgi:hypothetical protein